MKVNPVLIEIDNFTLIKGKRKILQNISFQFRANELVTLLGPNGAGKTSLARAAMGIIAADSGNIERKPSMTFGYVPQKISLNWTIPLTVSRMLSLASNNKAEIGNAMETTGIEQLAKLPIQSLSGGELQRVLLARAILRNPDFLVLDEPMSAVDFASKIRLYQFINAFRERTGCGILLISHDLSIVSLKTDRVLCINGHICCQGSPESITDHPEYIQLFGDAADSLAVYRHNPQHDHSHT